MIITVAGPGSHASQYRDARPVVDSAGALHLYVGKSSVVKAYYKKGDWKSFTTIDDTHDNVDWEATAEELAFVLQARTDAERLALTRYENAKKEGS